MITQLWDVGLTGIVLQVHSYDIQSSNRNNITNFEGVLFEQEAQISV